MDLDLALFSALNGLAGQSSFVDRLMLEVGHVSTILFPGLLALGYWLWWNRREALVGTATVAGLIAVADLLGAQVKHAVARPRPCQALEQVHEIVRCGSTFSFPSNHAVNTATAAAFFQVLYPRTGWVSWPLVGVVGFSRVYLGGHYVSDVIGGWLIGGLIGLAAGIVLLRWQKFRPRQVAPEASHRHDPPPA